MDKPVAYRGRSPCTMPYGVIGNTLSSGLSIFGSNPGRAAMHYAKQEASCLSREGMLVGSNPTAMCRVNGDSG
jgi:hypothetical protein